MLIDIDDKTADMHVAAIRLGDNPEVMARRILGYWYLEGYKRGRREAEERLSALEAAFAGLEQRCNEWRTEAPARDAAVANQLRKEPPQ